MAIAEKTVLTESFTAGADLSNSQYRFVKLNGNMQMVRCSAPTDIPVGVLQDRPKMGEAGRVMIIGRSKVSSNEALTAGWLIGTTNNGQAERKEPGTDSAHYIAGQVLHGSSSANIPASALINCASPARAQ